MGSVAMRGSGGDSNLHCRQRRKVRFRERGAIPRLCRRKRLDERAPPSVWYGCSCAGVRARRRRNSPYPPQL